MALDPGIILSGNSLDIAGSLDRGMVAGQRVADQRQKNMLREFYQTNGQGIMSGDPQALNALAGIDPNAAMKVQAQRLDQDRVRLGMDATRLNMQQAEQQMAMLSREEQRAIEDRAASMSVAERAAAAERLQQAATMGLQAQSPEQFDSIMQSMGLDQYVGQFANREALAARGLSTADAFKRYDEANAPDDAERYRAVGGNVYDWQPEGGGAPRVVSSGPGTEEVVIGPDGNPILYRGPAGGSAKFTETQAKDNVYSTRMEGALGTLNGQLEDGTFMADRLTSRANRAAELDPTGIAREFQDENFQVAKQAGDEFLLALLRKDTGAAVTESEQTTYGDVFLPRPGDQAPVLEAKRSARIRALEAVRSGMSAQQIAATGRAMVNAARESGQVRQQAEQGGPEIPEQAPTYLSPNDADLWNYMTPQEREYLLNAYPESGQ